MSRNSSGTYSLYTPGNPVVSGSVISSTWANNTLSDIATALTDSLSRTGDGGMQAPLELSDGAVGAPGLSWGTETTSGLYRASAGVFNYAISAATVLSMSATGFVFGGATGSFQGAGTINAKAFYDDGTLITNQAGANPTGTIGLTAVNGSAGTFLRSDGAPALSQAIAPTWTGNHLFRPASGAPFDGLRVGINGAGPAGVQFLGTDGRTVGDGNLLIFQLYNSSSAATSYAYIGTEIVAATAGAESGRLDLYTRNAGAGPTRRWSVLADGTVSGTGVYNGPVGSNSAPTYSFTGATNYGIYQASSDLFMSLNGTGYLIGFRQIPRSTTTTTFALTDVGKAVAVSAAINIPISVFSAGDAISVYNDSGSAVNITISAGTLRLSGTTTTGTRSLAARGWATLWFNVGGATPEVIAVGDVS